MSRLTRHLDIRPSEEIVLARPARWTEQANCKDTKGLADAEFFGAKRPEQCGPCPVRQQCLALGVASHSSGWWGGELLRPPTAQIEKRIELQRRFQEMYDAGHTDGEIGRATGVNRSTCTNWRNRNNLPLNQPALATMHSSRQTA